MVGNLFDKHPERFCGDGNEEVDGETTPGRVSSNRSNKTGLNAKLLIGIIGDNTCLDKARTRPRYKSEETSF